MNHSDIAVISDIHHTIQFKDGLWRVYAWGTYPENSVLAGQPMKQLKDSFDTCELAQGAYPDAMLSHDLLEPEVSIGPQPADWYGPEGGYSLCGEHWDEDD